MHYGRYDDKSMAFLSLGSNLGDRAGNLLGALAKLSAAGLEIRAISPIYQTDPVDNLDQPEFLNIAAAVGGFDGEPASLLGLCLQLESELGRVRAVRRGARTIDIDLLMFGDRVEDGVWDGISLTLPHPRMHLRRFVMTPMRDIAPDLRHPVIGHTMSEIFEALEDTSSVRIYRP